VADAYVYGLPDTFFGEIVAASVRLRPGPRESPADATGASAEMLAAWCADRLSRFKVPKHFRFVDEFPMTASGKIQKYKLREEHQAELQVSH
jgi:fatty-acyl-CoA synthase